MFLRYSLNPLIAENGKTFQNPLLMDFCWGYIFPKGGTNLLVNLFPRGTYLLGNMYRGVHISEGYKFPVTPAWISHSGPSLWLQTSPSRRAKRPRQPDGCGVWGPVYSINSSRWRTLCTGSLSGAPCIASRSRTAYALSRYMCIRSYQSASASLWTCHQKPGWMKEERVVRRMDMVSPRTVL